MDWFAAPSLAAMQTELDKRYPNRSKASDGTIGDSAHQARPASDHNPDAGGMVHARDITHDPEHGVDCAVLTEALRKRKDARIRYVIYKGRYFLGPGSDGVKAGKRLPWGWMPYTGPSPHEHHMHISVGYDAYSEHTNSPWWPTPKPATTKDDEMTPEQEQAFRKLIIDRTGSVFNQVNAKVGAAINEVRSLKAELAGLRTAIAAGGTGTLDPADIVQAAYEGATKALAEHETAEAGQ